MLHSMLTSLINEVAMEQVRRAARTARRAVVTSPRDRVPPSGGRCRVSVCVCARLCG